MSKTLQAPAVGFSFYSSPFIEISGKSGKVGEIRKKPEKSGGKLVIFHKVENFAG